MSVYRYNGWSSRRVARPALVKDRMISVAGEGSGSERSGARRGARKSGGWARGPDEEAVGRWRSQLPRSAPPLDTPRPIWATMEPRGTSLRRGTADDRVRPTRRPRQSGAETPIPAVAHLGELQDAVGTRGHRSDLTPTRHSPRRSQF